MKPLILLLAALLMLHGCSKAEQEPEGKPPHRQSGSAEMKATKSNWELGRQIYNFRCYYCHGYSGNAHTLAATFLTPKPRDFTATSPDALSKEQMLNAVRSGKKSTAMQSFSSVLAPDEINAVVDFIRQEFMFNKAENTRYHTVENGWFNHERYSSAFPFALGEIPLDTPWEQLTSQQANGKRLFMSSCVSCHDRALVNDEGVHWELRPVSYPRNHYSPGDSPQTGVNSESGNDAVTSASPYLLHDRAPKLQNLTKNERRGEALFQQNCAFCHAADGTGRNWIGSFLESHPRDLTSSKAMAGMTKTRLRKVIREGLIGTSMPAWKSVLSEQQIEDVIAYVDRAFHPLAQEH